MTLKYGISLLLVAASIASPVSALAQDDVNIPAKMVPPSQAAFIREAVSNNIEAAKYTPNTRAYDENMPRIGAEDHAIVLKYTNVIGWVCFVKSGTRNWEWYLDCDNRVRGMPRLTLQLALPNGATFEEKGGIYPGDIIEFDGKLDRFGMGVDPNGTEFYGDSDYVGIDVVVTNWKILKEAP